MRGVTFGPSQFLMLISLAVIIPGALLLSIDQNFRLYSGAEKFALQLGLWLLTSFATLRLIRLSGDLGLPFMAMAFYVFIYVWCGVIPLYQISVGLLPWRILPSFANMAVCIVIIAASIAAFEVGYRPDRKARLAAQGRDAGADRVFAITETRLFLFSAIAIAFAAYFGPLTTPISTLMSDRATSLNEAIELGLTRGTRLVQTTLMRIPIFITLLANLWFLRARRISLPLLLLIAVQIPLFTLVNFPIAVSRAWLGGVVLSFYFLWLVTSNVRTMGIQTFAIVLGMFVMYPLAHYARSSALNTPRTLSESIFSTYTEGSFDVAAMTAALFIATDRQEFEISWGEQLLAALFFWVPRSIWDDKPVGTGASIGTALDFEFTNLSAPLWIEGYANFGWIGVIVFLFLLGKVSRPIDGADRIDALDFRTFLKVFLPGTMFILMRGDLITAFTVIGPAVVFAWLLLSPRFVLRSR
ncbi:hypothetical protein C0V72_14285 [Porphyrobacter sp. TH134]|nr:hypothetical protein C0V72_14285 [Porphyrobacter sp. TH134]